MFEENATRAPRARARAASRRSSLDTIRDITERRRAEEALRRSEQALAAQAEALLNADRSKDEAILTAAVSLARSGCVANGQELALLMPADPLYLNADATRWSRSSATC